MNPLDGARRLRDIPVVSLRVVTGVTDAVLLAVILGARAAAALGQAGEA